MKQRLKYIQILFLLAATILSAGIFAQTSSATRDTIFNDFIATDNQKTAIKNGDSEVFICSFLKADKELFVKNYEPEIKRQLNDTTFIISLKKKNISKEFEQKFSWIKKANSLWKLSPDLLIQLKNQSILFPLAVMLSIDTTSADCQNLRNNFNLNKTTVSNIFIGTIKNYSIFNTILNSSSVQFIGVLSKHPKEELQINDLDLSVNKINVLHSDMPAFNGENITISIKENLPDTTDIDFGTRYMYNPLAAINYASHASIMATMAAGAGNSYYLGKGVANAATITSSDFNNLLPDADSNYRQFRIAVQNHSYGVGIENFYGADAAAYDASALKNDSLLFVFSAGNSGNLSATSGIYSGLPNQANITGSFKMAKNIITVGAVDSLKVVANKSSRGPAFDGRVAPCIVAYGEDGTSGAAALVSGTAALLQQAYKTLHNNRLPSSALLKAILVNTADAIGNTSLNYSSGYGNLNAFKAVKTVLTSSFFEGSVIDGVSKNFEIAIPANIVGAKFTLVWNDAPAQPNTYKALVNDLDITLKFAQTNQTWLPWVLNSFANTDSLAALPLRKRDSLNNIEQITLNNPVAGNYQLSINGFNIPAGNQHFYIAYQFDTINNFKFNFPASADNIFKDATNIIRWESNIITDSSKLFYSLNKGNSWQIIDTFINLHKEYFYWNAPDTNSMALLKMQAGSKDFLSEPFTISSKLNLKVGFNCQDSVLLYWEKLPGVLKYRLFSLQGKNLQPVIDLTDTFFVFKKLYNPYLQFAVAPLFDGHEGVKSYTTNYTQQGVDCYVSNFIGDLKADTLAYLQLRLGTNYFIKTIVFEKLKQGIFIALNEPYFNNALQVAATDSVLQDGINTYRAHIILQDGRDIYSHITSIFYFKNSTISIFPNPVVQNSYVTIQLKQLDNHLISITNVLGQTVYQKEAFGSNVKILFNFLKGLYFITVTNLEKSAKTFFKIIIF